MELIEDLGLQYPTEKSKLKKRYGMYMCPQCDRVVRVLSYDVETKRTVRCITCGNTTHGETKTRLFKIWAGMKARCNNSKDTGYYMYGAVGIKVCKKWNKKTSYSAFKRWAMLNGYADDLSIDRIDGKKNYKPSNCRWATPRTQSRNQKKIRVTNNSGYRGVGLSRNKLRYRARIFVNPKEISLGVYDTAEEAGLMYDKYVIENKLEHTRNFNDTEYKKIKQKYS